MEKEGLESVRIKRIGVISLANLSAIVYVFFGLLFGIFLKIGSLIVPVSLNFGIIFDIFWIFDVLFGWASIIILPILYGIIGWFLGAIGALVYNLAAKITKGMELYS
jgi:hypothetical protein